MLFSSLQTPFLVGGVARKWLKIRWGHGGQGGPGWMGAFFGLRGEVGASQAWVFLRWEYCGRKLPNSTQAGRVFCGIRSNRECVGYKDATAGAGSGDETGCEKQQRSDGGTPVCAAVHGCLSASSAQV